MIKDALNSDTGSILISIILGLGLSALFYKACDGQECRVIRGPNPKDLRDYVYRIQNECYKYTPYVTQCETEKRAVIQV